MIKGRCPICDKWIEAPGLTAAPDFPFCSPRCRLIDLGRWLGEDYKIPAARSNDPAADMDDSATTP